MEGEAVVTNIHERTVSMPIDVAREALASLASDNDRLWPVNKWPPMRLDNGLAVGSRGGHADVRYDVSSVGNDHVEFRFIHPFPLTGFHRFDLVASGAHATRFRHVLEGEPRGWMHLGWPLVVRPLHDAFIEDALDRVALEAGDEPRATWSPYVRAWRSLEARARRAS